MDRDQRLAKRRPEMQRIGGDGRLTMRVGMEAFMNAVDREGRAVLEPEGQSYWNDMKRLYPWCDTSGGKDKPIAIGLRNRWGRIKERRIYGDRGLVRVQRA
jgi:hypothetical protein